MHIVKLDAIGSTSNHLKSLCTKEHLPDGTVVVTNNQHSGRGQRGAAWISEPGKNLTFSLLKRFSGLGVDEHAKLNCLVALAMYAVLSKWKVPELKLKWPNDIMSGKDKICGILVENTVKGDEIVRSIIGVGLNVNQTNFKNLPRASSIKLATGTSLDLDLALVELVEQLQQYLESMDKHNWKNVQLRYEAVLYRKDMVSVFSCDNNPPFNGMIQGITKDGQLEVLLDNDKTLRFSSKEVKLHS